jgi:plasmid stabilization system protein ParE
VARVEWSAEAARSLSRLIETHSLPVDTRERVRRWLRPLERFPLLGATLGERRDLRFVLGPWRWMIVVYTHVAESEGVVVAAVEDGRSSTAATARR